MKKEGAVVLKIYCSGELGKALLRERSVWAVRWCAALGIIDFDVAAPFFMTAI